MKFSEKSSSRNDSEAMMETFISTDTLIIFSSSTLLLPKELHLLLPSELVLKREILFCVKLIYEMECIKDQENGRVAAQSTHVCISCIDKCLIMHTGFLRGLSKMMYCIKNPPLRGCCI